MQEATWRVIPLYLFFKLTKTNYLFDMRGLWPEELISSGRIQRYSFTHKYLERIEKVVF